MKFQAIFTSIQKVFLYLILVIVGLYAGMLFFHEMCPVETQLTPLEYANYWRIADGIFMHNRMAIMGPIMMALYLVTLLTFVKKWKSLAFIFLALSFVIFLLDVVYFNQEQAPINEYISRLDLKNITEEQLNEIGKMQIKSIANFHTRFYYGILSFLLLCTTPFLLLRANKEK